MTRHDRRSRLLAAGLSCLAGYVDALGFLKLGGFFVSFMSGNSTRLAVGLAERSMQAAIAASLVGAFVAGVVVGASVRRVAAGRPRAAVLALVAVLLAIAAALTAMGLPRAAVAVMALAMGAENAVFEREGEVSIALTYVTGTLVKLGQNVTKTLFGGERFGWAPYLMLWCGLVAGAVVGAAAYPHVGLEGLWLAAVVAAVFAVIAWKIDVEEGADDASLASH